MRTALVVDDSLTMREMVSQALTDCGFEVVGAANGQVALEALDARTVDLIISDINMPVMDGLSFIREVRGRSRHTGVPILMLTTESDDDMKAKGKQAGATGWLVKPFNPDMLRKVIAKVVP
jgi:two-component system chemotaxis response regulator CheY